MTCRNGDRAAICVQSLDQTLPDMIGCIGRQSIFGGARSVSKEKLP